jgi:hypothetical protein
MERSVPTLSENMRSPVLAYAMSHSGAVQHEEGLTEHVEPIVGPRFRRQSRPIPRMATSMEGEKLSYSRDTSAIGSMVMPAAGPL